mmetsp:Transcript_2338/g.3736  ORF Transcript_2338/g.3736 Transcript_2338/m.3736 type:complete len:337 (+) Transcript_2338:2-1012(+)
MARAYLKVDEILRETFLGCQEDYEVRWVCGRIVGESVNLQSTGRVSGSVNEDFDRLREDAGLTVDQPAFVLFCRDDNVKGARSWMLVAWVPDTAAPRLKMLYSSSREDLKTALGVGYFGGYKDYCANSESEMTWENLNHFEKCDEDAKPLTEAEILLQEEKKLEKDTSIKSCGMANIPFHIGEALDTALSENSFDCLEIALIFPPGDTLELLTSNTDPSISANLSCTNEPRFLLIQRASQLIFIYFCPDEASLKHKMTYSTAKATFIDILRSRNFVPSKSIEVRDANDLDADLTAALNTDSDSREITHATSTKPTAPGRRARSGSKPKKWKPQASP